MKEHEGIMVKQEKIAGGGAGTGQTPAVNHDRQGQASVYTDFLSIAGAGMRQVAPVSSQEQTLTPNVPQPPKLTDKFFVRLPEGYMNRLNLAAARARRTPSDFARLALIDAIDAQVPAPAGKAEVAA
jgi:hypothetical protein